jgi:CheY-like chemotaxis protein
MPVSKLLSGRAVLVADDDADTVEILEYLIRERGGEVRSAKNAREALEHLLTWTPDVLLLDIAMPDGDGFELLETIRGVARLRDVPAVSISADVVGDARIRCIDAGFVEHVSKPFDADALLALVADLAGMKPAAC